jgi:hypothetical protein
MQSTKIQQSNSNNLFLARIKNRHRTGTDLQRQLYLIKIVIPKFDPLTVTGMALSVDLGCSDRLTTVSLF